MNYKAFERFTKDVFKECEQILKSKGPDYSASSDRLANFTEVAAEAGISPQQVLWVLISKHLRAVRTYVKTGVLTGEPIQEKLNDIINYAVLFRALELEQRFNKHNANRKKTAR